MDENIFFVFIWQITYFPFQEPQWVQGTPEALLLSCCWLPGKNSLHNFTIGKGRHQKTWLPKKDNINEIRDIMYNRRGIWVCVCLRWNFSVQFELLNSFLNVKTHTCEGVYFNKCDPSITFLYWLYQHPLWSQTPSLISRVQRLLILSSMICDNLSQARIWWVISEQSTLVNTCACFFKMCI